MVTNPTHAMAAAWSTLVSQWGDVGEGLIGVLGWLDTHLPHRFVQMAAVVLVLALLSASTGPARRPWLSMVVIMIGMAALYFTFYFTGSS